MNQYKLKGILVTLMLFHMLLIFAQYTDINLQNDTIDGRNKTPNRLFDNTLIDNTGSISTVSGETLNKINAPNLYNTFAGQLAGLYTIQSKGEPGNDAPLLYIRGGGSYGSGFYNSPKLYVDGFEVTSDYINYLSPSEIESVSVFKDASSLATFGMNGANGVIWIKTKRAKIGNPSFTLQVRTGIQQAVNTNKPLNSYDFANLYNQAISNDNGSWTPYYSKNELENYKNGVGNNVDWYDEVMKEQGNYTNLDFIFNGAIKKAKYNIVLNYSNQRGLFNVDNTDQTSNKLMDKFNVRANLDFNLFDFIDASVDFGTRLENIKGPNYDYIMEDLAAYPSNIYPVYDELVVDDELNFSGTTLYPNNPVGSIKGLGWKSSSSRIMQGNFKFRENLDFITDGLFLKQSFSFFSHSNSIYSKTRNYARYFMGLPTTTDQTTSIIASKYSPWGMIQWLQGDVALGYSKSFDNQKVESFLNFNTSDYSGEGFSGYKNRNMNFSGRANYMYNERYVGEFGFSYFGSDAYAPGNRWGFYPTISGAWIMSNENFMKDNDIIDFMKLRGSIGKSGNINSYDITNQGRFLYQEYFTWSTAFYTGMTAPFTGQGSLKPIYIANEKVFAEKSTKYNIGVDVSLLNKLKFTGDLFLDKRSNILTKTNSQMDYYGNYNYFDNIGRMSQKGFEVSISYTDKIYDFNYSLHGMFSYATSILDFIDEIPLAYSYNEYTNRPYGTMIGLQADGFYDLEDFNEIGALKDNLPIPLFGNVQPGDIKYKDLDGDGYVDQTDVTKIGNPSRPNLSYSFAAQAEYKGFDLNILFQGAAGASVNLLTYGSQFIAFVNNGNAYDNALGAWAYYPEQGIDTRNVATYPRLTTQSNENNYRNSSFWIRDNNYIRLKNIEIGYNLAERLLKIKGISTLRVFYNANNPITFSKLLKDYNMDPEAGYGYPSLKSHNIGVNVTF